MKTSHTVTVAKIKQSELAYKEYPLLFHYEFLCCKSWTGILMPDLEVHTKL